MRVLVFLLPLALGIVLLLWGFFKKKTLCIWVGIICIFISVILAAIPYFYRGKSFVNYTVPPHAAVDPKTGSLYVPNQLIVLAKKGSDQSSIQKAIESVGATVSSYDSFFLQYVIEFPKTITYDQLIEAREKLKLSPDIDLVLKNAVLVPN